jgi:uncharacterized protein YacL
MQQEWDWPPSRPQKTLELKANGTRPFERLSWSHPKVRTAVLIYTRTIGLILKLLIAAILSVIGFMAFWLLYHLIAI